MKVQIPNREYLIPKIIVSEIGSKNLNYSQLFSENTFGRNGISLFRPGPVSLPTTFNLSDNTETLKAVFASVDFNIQNENFDLFWSNFGYVGKVGENIYVILAPNPDELFAKMEIRHPGDFSKAQNNENATDPYLRYLDGTDEKWIFAIDKISAKFVVIVDPYYEFSDDIQILLDMLQYATFYGSVSPDYPVSSSTIKAKYKSLYSLIKTSQITQTYEVYSFNAELYSYQLIHKTYTYGSPPTELPFILLGICAKLTEIPEKVPFKINFVGNNNEVFIAENSIISSDDKYDYKILQPLFKHYNRTHLLKYDNNYFGSNAWSFDSFINSLSQITQEIVPKLFYLPEVLTTTLVPIAIMSPTESPKNYLHFTNAQTNLQSINALKKLISLEGFYTRIWGETPKSNLTGTKYNNIEDLYDSPSEKPSIAFKGFTAQVLLDPENPIHDPAYTEFYYILTPGISIIQPDHYEIMSDILTITENREDDSIYIIPVVSFPILNDGTIDLDNIYPIDDVIKFFQSEMYGHKNSVGLYPDAFITHPYTGDLTVIDTSVIYSILFGKLGKIYESPAGSLRGVIDYVSKFVRRLTKVQADQLYTFAHINPVLKPTKYANFQVEGNRMTYKKESRVKSALSYVNVKGLIQYLIRALREILYTFKFEPNDPFLFTRFSAMFVPILERLVAERALYAYKLKNLTTDQDINAGKFVVGIGIQPTREAEIIEGRIYVFAAGSEIKFE